jgi:hypothetical protein
MLSPLFWFIGWTITFSLYGAGLHLAIRDGSAERWWYRNMRRVTQVIVLVLSLAAWASNADHLVICIGWQR